MKINKTAILMMSIFIIILPYVDSLPTPHGISGTVYELDGITKIKYEVEFSVHDTTNGQLIQGKTGRGGQGSYSVSLNGNNDDIIIVKAWNKAHSTNITLSLEGVMRGVDLFLNMTLPPYPPNITSIPVTEGSQDSFYQYDVEASDDNYEDILTYSLITKPAGMSIDPETGLIYWTPTNNDVGFNDVVVQVSDGELTDSQAYTIYVENVNDAPEILSTPVETATEDEIYNYQIDANDIDGDDLTYLLTEGPAGMTIDSETGLVNWMPLNEDVGNNDITVMVSDNELTESQSFTLYVENINDEPVIISIPIRTATEDLLYIYNIDATDEDNDVLSYSLLSAPEGMTIDPETGTIRWLPENNDVGSNNVVVQVSDTESSVTQSFVVNVSNINDLPIITSVPTTTATEDLEYSYDVQAIDVDNDILHYSLESSPNGMVINIDTGEITWIPRDDDVGLNNISIKIDDDEGFTLHMFVINVLNVNDAPEIISSATLNATQGSAYYYDVNATDVDNEHLIYSLSASPQEMIMDSSSGLIYWTPTNNDIGFNDVVAQVSDGELTDSQSFTIYVENVNDAPNITSTPIKEAIESLEYIYYVKAEDLDNDSLTYSLLVSPEGMKIDKFTGKIRWIPDKKQIGENEIVVYVSDGNMTAEQIFSINVMESNKISKITDIDLGVKTKHTAFFKAKEEFSKTDKKIEESDIPVLGIKIKSGSKNEIDIKVRVLKDRPNDVSKRISKKVYKYLSIEKTEQQIGENEVFVIKFRVDKDWITQNGLEFDEVVLSRYNDLRWKELSTKMKDSDKRYVYYEAQTPGFSYFAITVKEGIKAKPIAQYDISTIEAPYRLTGIVHQKNKEQIPEGVKFAVKNLESKEVVKSETGIGKDSGAYYLLLKGEIGDRLKIKIDRSETFFITLKGDMEVNFTVEKTYKKTERPAKITGLGSVNIVKKILIESSIADLTLLIMNMAGIIIIIFVAGISMRKRK